MTSTSSPTELSNGNIVLLNDFLHDVSFNNTEIDLNLSSNTQNYIDVELTCSVSNNTSISYSIVKNDSDVEISNLIAYIDLDKSQIVINAPLYNVATTLNYRIKSSYPSYTSYRNLNITVQACGVSNCAKCSSNNINQCSECDSGYELSNYKCNRKSRGLQKIILIAQITVGIGVGSSLGVSLAKQSSPQSTFSIFNQLQIILLLPLTRVYLPYDVIEFIKGMNFVTLTLHFIPFDEVIIPGSWTRKV